MNQSMHNPIFCSQFCSLHTTATTPRKISFQLPKQFVCSLQATTNSKVRFLLQPTKSTSIRNMNCCFDGSNQASWYPNLYSTFTLCRPNSIQSYYLVVYILQAWHIQTWETMYFQDLGGRMENYVIMRTCPPSERMQ
jgi:hypothetical protein